MPFVCVCVFYPVPSEDRSLLLLKESKRDILNATLLARLTIIYNEGVNILHITLNYLETMQMSRQPK